MIKIKFDMPENYLQVSKIYESEFRTAMYESVTMLEGAVIKGTPVFLAFLRNGIFGKVISAYRGVVGVAGPAQIYAWVVEAGRKPGGKFPPPDAIARWLKGSIKGKRFVAEIKAAYGIKKDSTALKSATFLKSRGIANKGTKGAFMFEKGQIETEPRIRRRFNKAAQRANARL